MSIFLGNIRFDQVEEMFGYELTEDDKKIWDRFYSNKADLSEKGSCFHAFDIPRCIKFKGEEAGRAILAMFTSDKITNPIGEFTVYAQEETEMRDDQREHVETTQERRRPA